MFHHLPVTAMGIPPISATDEALMNFSVNEQIVQVHFPPIAEGEGLEIIWQDDSFVAVNKPAGLLVHRTPLDPREERFALQLVRDLIGRRVYPVHRLDKPTSGVLLFALSPEAARSLTEAFTARQPEKTY